MISLEKVLKDHVAAISCGVVGGQPVIDLDYLEDSNAGTDANFVMTARAALSKSRARPKVIRSVRMSSCR